MTNGLFSLPAAGQATFMKHFNGNERNAMPPNCRTHKNIPSSWIGCQKTEPKDMIRKLRKPTYVPKVPNLGPSPETKDKTTARNNQVS
jgi:hypothetical protein